MNIEIINIGDEILIGQVINTNAAWMAQELNKAGYMVSRFTVVPDTREGILSGLEEAHDRADLVLISGGLGPTKDDITKQTICAFFDTRLVFNTEAFRDLEILFSKRGWSLPINELNRQQAELPETCISLPNYIGTARGMWFETGGRADKRTSGRADGRTGGRADGRTSGQADGRTGGQADKRTSNIEHRTSNIEHRTSSIFIFLPGVPFEMQEMMTREVLPRVIRRFPPHVVVHKTILTQGKGESLIAEILQEWEESLPGYIKLAYLPQPGIVRLRLTASGEDKERLEQEVSTEIATLQRLIPDLIFGYDDDTLEAVVGELLLQEKTKLSMAESCTGGYIAHLITSVPGSSAWFAGGIVAYANAAKEELLYVKPDTLALHGAVSEQVALEMAAGARVRFGSDYAIATTGIAGPTGGTPEKPVGTVWIAIASPIGIRAYHFLFGDHRERNIRRTAVTALNLLRKLL